MKIIVKNMNHYEAALIRELKERGNMTKEKAENALLEIRNICVGDSEISLKFMKNLNELHKCPDVIELINDYISGNMEKYSHLKEEVEDVEDGDDAEDMEEVVDDDRDLTSLDAYGFATDPFEHLVQLSRDLRRYK